MRNKLSSPLKSLFALGIGLLIAALLAEGILRLYNPIPFRVKGDKIILPVNKKYVIHNTTIKPLDTLIIHTKNSLGFRGPEKPDNFDSCLSLIAVGGSTTECYYLSDGKEWVSRLGKKLAAQYDNIWVNNAGLDGQSTFGHYILLTDYLIHIHPDFILYLVGCNDVGREDLSYYDRDKMQGEYLSFKNFFTKNSELIALLVNISRGWRAQQRNMAHIQNMDLTKKGHARLDTLFLKKELLRHEPLAAAYKERLTRLVRKTKEGNIRPILVTQPCLVGKGTDDITGVNLETVQLMSDAGGIVYWSVLEKYNDATRQVAEQENAVLIDLARAMPKSTKYFYDAIHFTNEGAEKVSEILFEELSHKLTHFK